MTQRARATQEASYLSTFDSLERDGFKHDPAWLRKQRREAISRFSDLGFPVVRRGNEEWKYTDVGPLAKVPFGVLNEQQAVHVPASEIDHHAFAGTHGSRLVFVNGRYSPEHSSTEALPPEVRLCNLRDALKGPVGRHLGKYADYRGHAFTALNTAFVQDGGFLHVPSGTALSAAIQLIFLSTATPTDTVSHPRVLILMDRESRATVIESYIGPMGGRYFTNAVAEVVLEAGARLDHYKLQTESAGSFHVATIEVRQEGESTYTSLLMDHGGGLVRNNVNVLLHEEGARAELRGLYLLNEQQHVDYNTFVDHAVPNTSSDELYKGVLSGKAHVVFGGKMLVRPNAQKTSSHQVNKTLLLSEGAAVDTKPQLEIYADDVKCNHGAAIGQMDRDAIFYLKSRGLDDLGARELLTSGFVSEVPATITHVPFRAYLEQLVHTRLREL